jgi:hypothetical protein
LTKRVPFTQIGIIDHQVNDPPQQVRRPSWNWQLKILNRLNFTKPQRRFLLRLYTTLLAVRGKATFRNLSRYSDLSEKTYSRQFAQAFDGIAFNRKLIDEALGTESERILALDPCFIPS